MVFSMILPCPRYPKTAKNHLVAKRHRDSQHSSQMTSKSVQFWSQNGSKIGPKIVSRKGLEFALLFGLLLGPNLDPKMVPKRLQNWTRNGVGCPAVLLEPQVGPKTDPKWLRSPKMDPKMAPKWLQNVTFGSGLPLIHGTWQAQAECAKR